MACSTLIIMLNVIVVGAGDLRISEFTVGVLMVVGSIVKAVQLKYTFDTLADECNVATGALRDQELAVRALLFAADNSNDGVTKEEFDKVEKGVVKAIKASPSYISIDTDTLKQSLKRDPKRVGASEGEAVGDKDREALLAEKGPEHSEDHGGPAPSLRPAGVGDQADQQSEEGKEPKREADKVVGAEQTAGVESEEVKQWKSELNKQLLVDILKSINFGTKYARNRVQGLGIANTTFTCTELGLNVAILCISSIARSQSSTGNDVIAVLAAINAISKGLQMKLAIDVKEMEAKRAYFQFGVFREKANKLRTMQVRRDKSGNPPKQFDEDLAREFEEVALEFEALVVNYPDWLCYREHRSRTSIRSTS